MKRKLFVLYRRNEKTLSCILYVFLLILSFYAMYDPVSFMSWIFSAPNTQAKGKAPKSNDVNPKRPIENGGLSDSEREKYLQIYYKYTTTKRTPSELRYINIPFIPKNQHKCDDIFEQSDANFSYSEFYLDHMDAYKSALTSIDKLEDSSVNEQSWAFHMLAQMEFVTTVCESFYNYTTICCIRGTSVRNFLKT